MAGTSERGLCALHITDFHLFGDSKGQLLGVTTEQTLSTVIDNALSRDGTPDVVIATGDLSQDGTPEAYRRLHAILDAIGAPVLCLPGNHDEPALLDLHLAGGNVRTARCNVLDHWQLIMLDTTSAGNVGGHLDADELAALEHALQAKPELHALICLHHHPVPTGSRWMDGIGLNNADALFEVIDGYSNVKALLWGHVHQEFCADRNGVKLMSSPSTCFQFKPRSREFALDDASPGYRLLRLGSGGGLESVVRRVRAAGARGHSGAGGY